MKYTVKRYLGGKYSGETEIEGTSPKAVSTALGLGYSSIVVGKTIKVFDKKLKEIKAEPRIFKFGENGKYGVLVLYHNIPFKFKFKYKTTRDEAFQKCTDLISANYAKGAKLLTAIIVSLEETSGLKSGSMSQKTLKDYVESVTTPELWIATNTDSGSGESDAKNLGSLTWLNGLNLSHSELLKKTFWVKGADNLCEIEDDAHEVGLVIGMKELSGKTFQVKLYDWYGQYIFCGIGKGPHGNLYKWMPEWLVPSEPVESSEPMEA